MDKTLTVISGGQDVEVEFLDGHQETITVRQLTIRELPKYLNTVQDEPATVELFCAKPAGWADTLKHDSYAKLIEVGEGLNLDPLSAYSQRQVKRQKALMPEEYARLEKRLIDQAVQRLPGTLPGSPHRPE